MEKVICTIYPDNEVHYEIISVDEKILEIGGKKIIFERVKVREIENPSVTLIIDKSFVNIIEN